MTIQKLSKKKTSTLVNNSRKGFIYFAQAGTGGPVKIGFTSGHPARRIRTLQDACPYELIWIGCMPSIARGEEQIHRQFAREWMRAEWFLPSENLLEFIRAKCSDFTADGVDEVIFHRSLVDSIKAAIGKKRAARALLDNCLKKHGIDGLGQLHQWFDMMRAPSEGLVQGTKDAFQQFIALRDERKAA
jgi:hypothetical protein